MNSIKIAFATTFDPTDVNEFSGTPYHMSKAFFDMGMEMYYIKNLLRQLPLFFKIKQCWSRYFYGVSESKRLNLYTIKGYSAQASKQLQSLNVDAIIAPLLNPIAYLDCSQPIVFWADALLFPIYMTYSVSTTSRDFDKGHYSRKVMEDLHESTQACLSRCRLVIFASAWGAETAQEHYKIAPERVKVVPYGANLSTYPDLDEIHCIVNQRQFDKIKLLFLGKDWIRKGGDTVLAVANALHAANYPVELTIVGCMPPEYLVRSLPSYIKCLRFISKNSEAGRARINQLLIDTHFLFVPSRAEAYGIVFCEANAFAVPNLTTDVGGIPTVVKNEINGMTFPVDTPISAYCDYIVNVLQNPKRYRALALSSYHEYLTRLNWQTATQTVRHLLMEVL